MTENEPGLFQQVLFFMAMIGAWIAGEAGRALLAGPVLKSLGDDALKPYLCLV